MPGLKGSGAIQSSQHLLPAAKQCLWKACPLSSLPRTIVTIPLAWCGSVSLHFAPPKGLIASPWALVLSTLSGCCVTLLTCHPFIPHTHFNTPVNALHTIVSHASSGPAGSEHVRFLTPGSRPLSGTGRQGRRARLTRGWVQCGGKNSHSSGSSWLSHLPAV